MNITTDATSQSPAKPSRLWLWFVAAFMIQFAVWAAWFVIAAHNEVEEVPLATTGRGIR